MPDYRAAPSVKALPPNVKNCLTFAEGDKKTNEMCNMLLIATYLSTSNQSETTKAHMTDHIEIARKILSGEHFTPDQIRVTAHALKSDEKYSIASDLFHKLLETPHPDHIRKDSIGLVTCYYKDVYLSPRLRFEKAFTLLNQFQNASTSTDFEILGIAGAIHKYKWMVLHKDDDLIVSRDFYRRGYELWKNQFGKKNFQYNLSLHKASKESEKPIAQDKDAGYNAINYALVLELLAWDRTTRKGNIHEFTLRRVLEYCLEAQEVRQSVRGYFDAPVTLEDTDLHSWNFATLGEIHAGLGDYQKAQELYGFYLNRERDSWKRNTTARQFTALCITQERLATYLQGAKAWFEAYKPKVKKKGEEEIENLPNEVVVTQTDPVEIQQQDTENLPTEVVVTKTDPQEIQLLEIENLLGEVVLAQTDPLDIHVQSKETFSHLITLMRGKESSTPDIAMRGKVGLALSGGGFRASLYHIGVLARLAELDMLRHVEVLSCVSGGSILGAFYYIKLKTLLEKKGEIACTREDYIMLVQEMEKEFLAGVQKNLRLRITANVCQNLRIAFNYDYTRTHRLATLYDRYLYNPLKVKWLEATKGNSTSRLPEDEHVHWHMHETRIVPEPGFHPGRENWYRSDKVPTLIINATTLNTGHNFQFTSTWMGEPPGAINTDLDAKARLRRMYYNEAPMPYTNHIRLSEAVGASSCVPALFEPLVFEGLYKDIELRLVDGGVHDNQGVGSLLEQGCQVMIVSDASGQMTNAEVLGSGPLNAFSRSDLILQERVREKQLSDLQDRYDAGFLNGLVIMHLKRDLQSDPIKWKNCEFPTKLAWLTSKEDPNKDLTTYGIRMDVAEAISKIRTDLDTFSDAEAFALMYAGYKQTESELAKSALVEQPEEVLALDSMEVLQKRWQFWQVKDYAERGEKSVALLHRLSMSEKLMFKEYLIDTKWRLAPKILFGILSAIVVWLIYRHFDAKFPEHGIQFTVKALAFALAFFVGDILIGFAASKIVNFKGTLIKAAILAVGAIIASIVSSIALRCFDRAYLSFGKIVSLEREDKILKCWHSVKGYFRL